MTWLGVTMILLMILLTNQFARVLGDVAKGKLPKNAAFEVIGLSAAQYLTILVPIGLFLAVMLALGRLYRDSEMPAMMACRFLRAPHMAPAFRQSSSAQESALCKTSPSTSSE